MRAGSSQDIVIRIVTPLGIIPAIPMSITGSSFPFERWHMFRSRLLWAYEKIFERFDELYISFPVAGWRILKGEIELRGDGGSREIYPEGYWVFPRAGTGRLHFAPKTRIISMRFKAEWFHGVSIFSREQTITFPAKGCPLNPVAQSLVQFVREISGTSPSGIPVGCDFGEFLKLGSAFSQWILAYYETLMQHGAKFQSLEGLTGKVQLALEFMEHRPFSHRLCTTEIAAHVGVSVSQLNKLFMQETGTTPSMVWNRRKLTRAKEELFRGVESIKAIAYQLGYSSPAHFSYWFRTNTGLAPTEFRLQHGNDYQFL